VLHGCINRAMMEAASTPETSVNFYQAARRNNPEDSHLHLKFLVYLLGTPSFLLSPGPRYSGPSVNDNNWFHENLR
jgi:hypothetical protein